jgi:C4-dicarboxylate-specific signal transduction histidine kinase
MKTACALALILMGVVVVAPASAEKASPAIVDYVQTQIVPLGTDPVIVAAVKAENARRKSLDQIKELDEKWKRTPGIADYMKALMDSACGSRLRSLQSAAGFFAEAFVMDNQGANVCMSDKTSDYWQGDEAKFQQSYKGGAGAVFIDEVAFDESSQKYVVQASVPVKDGDNVIGALTVSVDLDAFESR